MPIPEPLRKFSQVHVQARAKYAYELVVHGGKLVVQHEHKQAYWKLYSAVVGRLEAAIREPQPPLSKIIRELVILPDQTTLLRFKELLKGKKREHILDSAFHEVMGGALDEHQAHRNELMARLKKREKIFWHNT